MGASKDSFTGRALGNLCHMLVDTSGRRLADKRLDQSIEDEAQEGGDFI